MNWMFAHAYVVFLGIALLIVVTAGAVIQDAPPEKTSRTGWGRVGGFSLNKAPQHVPQREEAVLPSATGPEAESYSPISIRSTFEEPSEALLDEWQSLLTNLVEPTTQEAEQDTESSGSAYSFIPRGLISAPEPGEHKTREQLELFDYGNRVGGYIRDFETFHTNMITILKDAYGDRKNITKRAAAEKIGEDYKRLGKDLEAMKGIPAAVEKMHLSIARAYQSAGEKMIVKLRAGSDDEFLAAVNDYNASALEFTNSFVAIATYLSAAGVKFSTGDAGSVFTFTSI